MTSINKSLFFVSLFFICVSLNHCGGNENVSPISLGLNSVIILENNTPHFAPVNTNQIKIQIFDETGKKMIACIDKDTNVVLKRIQPTITYASLKTPFKTLSSHEINDDTKLLIKLINAENNSECHEISESDIELFEKVVTYKEAISNPIVFDNLVEVIFYNTNDSSTTGIPQPSLSNGIVPEDGILILDQVGFYNKNLKLGDTNDIGDYPFQSKDPEIDLYLVSAETGQWIGCVNMNFVVYGGVTYATINRPFSDKGGNLFEISSLDPNLEYKFMMMESDVGFHCANGAFIENKTYQASQPSTSPLKLSDFGKKIELENNYGFVQFNFKKGQALSVALDEIQLHQSNKFPFSKDNHNSIEIQVYSKDKKDFLSCLGPKEKGQLNRLTPEINYGNLAASLLNRTIFETELRIDLMSVIDYSAGCGKSQVNLIASQLVHIDDLFAGPVKIEDVATLFLTNNENPSREIKPDPDNENGFLSVNQISINPGESKSPKITFVDPNFGLYLYPSSAEKGSQGWIACADLSHLPFTDVTYSSLDTFFVDRNMKKINIDELNASYRLELSVQGTLKCPGHTDAITKKYTAPYLTFVSQTDELQSSSLLESIGFTNGFNSGAFMELILRDE